ncbi:hypothetical protein JYU34_000336 [Plutella xylostella]|uniref:Suppressor of cytokine signaling 7 n=1 Tax=Plutella xylostella TaxID=51655 RepID=A0ABQ7R7G6_PLUXY|nr:hypothetical protein JYU34_000336 [Plutella xylostella]
MESPPSFSTHSEVPLLSEDSGLFITSGSFSSDSASGWHHITSELQESDYDERSLSFCESTPERMCGGNFNTVKKGPGKVIVTTIEPPPEFQDSPVPVVSINKCDSVEGPLCTDDTYECVVGGGVFARSLKPERGLARYASPRLPPRSPHRRVSSRLSSSHNSLVTQFQADDSSFITQAISHDTLSSNTCDITDMYNVPLDSDIYAVPIDMVKPITNLRHKTNKQRAAKKRKSVSHPTGMNHPPERNHKSNKDSCSTRTKETKPKRHSFQISTAKKNMSESEAERDSLHMTLREMRKYLHTLYSSSSESERGAARAGAGAGARDDATDVNGNGKLAYKEPKPCPRETNNNTNKKTTKNTLVVSKGKHKESDADCKSKVSVSSGGTKSRMAPVKLLSLNLKQSFCNLFRWRRGGGGEAEGAAGAGPARRALPPLPPPLPSPPPARAAAADDPVTDFATSIQKVKDYGWYWGPISVEHAEKILSNEPDGSFIVRDSSDDHYIFTLTFKLNGLRHVRIEHDQGNFCFGGCAMFKAQTIVEFIENAVETSRSGRYLFFLNLRPVLGPVRVQLLYPVSRFKRVQSLQHMCRFVILKYVRRDLISGLPLPRRLVDYLSATHYYSELLSEI